MVSGRLGQSWHQTNCRRGQPLFRPFAGLDRTPLAGQPDRAHARCQHAGRALRRAGGLCGVSRLRHPGRLVAPAGRAPDWTVLVLADRGLYARWLFRRIVRLGWHPMLRINQGCKFRPAGEAQFVWLRELVGEVGGRWRGRGTAFVSPDCRLDCTLVAWWGEGHAEPWFVLTDLAPDGCDAQWYGLRGWCEQAFRSLKRGCWQWQQTQMQDPARAARLWLALALATLWMLTVGGELECGPSAEQPELPDLSTILGVRPAQQPRRLRLLRLGWLWLLVQLLQGKPVPLPRLLLPEPWPDIPERLEATIAHSKAFSYACM
jgi:hypothetical protein